MKPALRPFFFLSATTVLAWPVSGFGLDYEKDIMPIFMEKCADCHSSQSEKVKGALKFDDAEHFQKRFDKNSVVVPGDFDASYLFLTLFRPEDDDDAMPPKGKGERLTADEVKLVLEWITEGAPINGTRGARGELPEDMDDLLKDLPASAGGTAGGAVGGLPAMAKEQDWTNHEGKTIRATLLKVDGEFVFFRMADGTVHRYPVANLSDESRKNLNPESK
ncbi:MAG: hypothetical protein KDN20_09250 [Verrucomicrobiae bacterium]|nr:hypothetical protein [Verrucomicrobiae bacterium]